MFNINRSLKQNYKFYITVFITILCFITTLISVGFGALNQDLNIAGDVEYEEHNNLLYNVFKRESEVGSHALEYTGNHHDSFTEEPTKKIYYWNYFTETLDKWNVLFGGFCWQMFRTTDTGGVKLIYSGVPNDGKCNNTGRTQVLGDYSQFNSNFNSPAYIGYMYNKVYETQSITPDYTPIFDQIYMSSSYNYYYGTGVTFDSSTGKYTLTDAFQDTWANIYNSSSGLYTCRSSYDSTCSTVFYISSGISYRMYGFNMKNGNLLNYYNTNITVGTGYTESNGVYTLTNTSTMTRMDWFNNYRTYKGYYMCDNDIVSCSKLKKITYTDNYYYYSISTDDNYDYANNFTYDSTTNIYTLGSDKVQLWDMTEESNITQLNNHHYTCFNETGECSTLSYIYHVDTPTNYRYKFYINLKNGKSVEDALNEMLYDDDVNQINSTVKTYIDNWYASNLLDYTSMLEDTIFCNNRRQSDNSHGWNSNGGSVVNYMYFDQTDLLCINDTDKFSTQNNKARLTYPIGLPDISEMDLMWSPSYILTNISFSYTTLSPRCFDEDDAVVHGVDSSGSFDNVNVGNGNGVRPVISLKPGTEYTSGDGSKINPYVVE